MSTAKRNVISSIIRAFVTKIAGNAGVIGLLGHTGTISTMGQPHLPMDGSCTNMVSRWKSIFTHLTTCLV